MKDEPPLVTRLRTVYLLGTYDFGKLQDRHRHFPGRLPKDCAAGSEEAKPGGSSATAANPTRGSGTVLFRTNQFLLSMFQIVPETVPEPNTHKKRQAYRGPRFYAVTKDECLDPRTPRKRKTRHSNNPPIEHHVGWVMDVKEHRPRTSSAGSSFGTSPSESHLATSFGSVPSALPTFQHPSHALLKENNFTQQAYHKYRQRCLKGTRMLLTGGREIIVFVFRKETFR